LARVEESGGTVGIAFRTVDGKEEWYSRADETFHAASTMKVAVLIELFHQVKEGKLKLGGTLPIKNEFHSIVDGSIYKLDVADDSEAELYKAEGQTRTLEQLAELMITVSSNLATNLIVEKLGVENVRATVHAMGADGVNVLRGVEDQKAFDKGLNNTTTARGLAILMTAIAEEKAVDAESSEQMAAILKRQKFNDAIPSGLPSGTIVAHKTGDITKIHHDAAIVYAKRPFVLVLLSLRSRMNAGALATTNSAPGCWKSCQRRKSRACTGKWLVQLNRHIVMTWKHWQANTKRWRTILIRQG